MHKIAILGFGWLGFPLGKALKQEAFNVCGTTTSEAKLALFKEQGLETIFWENGEFDLKMNQVFFQGVDCCILNIPPGKINSNYSDYLLRLCDSFSDQCNFIFTSSTGVYQDLNKIIRENEVRASDFVLEHPVYLAELALKQRLKSRLTILRLAGLIGENRNPAKFFAAKQGISNGKNPINMVHLTDVIDLIQKVIELKCFGQVINVCSDNHPEKSKFYTQQCLKMGLEPPKFIDELSSWKIIDNTLSKELLNFTYQINF